MVVSTLEAEVAYSAVSGDRYVVALVPRWGVGGLGKRHEPGAWLFTLQGGATALRETLDALGCLGAVRSDLQEAFSLTTQVLGEGAQATVRLAFESGTGLPAALKVAGEPCPEAEAALRAEMLALVQVQGHPNIIRCLGLFRAPHAFSAAQLVLALQYCTGGDLAAYVGTRGPQPEGAAAGLMHGVLAAISHIHKRSIVHRDIKANNIFLSEDGKAVVADFGVSAFLSDVAAMASRRGTPGYAAPEMLVCPFRYGNKVDVFAFGVTVFYLLFGSLPFQGEDGDELCRSVVMCRVAEQAAPQLAKVSAAGKALLLGTLTKCAMRRPSAAAALTHAWFSQHALDTAADCSSTAVATSQLERPEVPLLPGCPGHTQPIPRLQALQARNAPHPRQCPVVGSPLDSGDEAVRWARARPSGPVQPRLHGRYWFREGASGKAIASVRQPFRTLLCGARWTAARFWLTMFSHCPDESRAEGLKAATTDMVSGPGPCLTGATNRATEIVRPVPEGVSAKRVRQRGTTETATAHQVFRAVVPHHL